MLSAAPGGEANVDGQTGAAGEEAAGLVVAPPIVLGDNTGVTTVKMDLPPSWVALDNFAPRKWPGPRRAERAHAGQGTC